MGLALKRFLLGLKGLEAIALLRHITTALDRDSFQSIGKGTLTYKDM